MYEYSLLCDESPKMHCTASVASEELYVPQSREVLSPNASLLHLFKEWSGAPLVRLLLTDH